MESVPPETNAEWLTVMMSSVWDLREQSAIKPPKKQKHVLDEVIVLGIVYKRINAQTVLCVTTGKQTDQIRGGPFHKVNK